MSAKARINKFRNQLRLQAIQNYKQSIRKQLTKPQHQNFHFPIMDIQSIDQDSSKSNSIIKSYANLLYCETNNKKISDFDYLVRNSDEIKLIAKRFLSHTENKQFNGQSIEDLCKLVNFVCYCIQSGKYKSQKLKCIQVCYFTLPNMLQEISQLCINLIIPTNNSLLELISLINLLIGILTVKIQRRENDQIDIEFLSFLVLYKLDFMKQTRLLTHNTIINNAFYLVERVIDCVFITEQGVHQTILNHSLKAMNLITKETKLWQNQKFQQMFQSFVQRSYDLLQERVVQNIWNQNFIQLLKLIYQKSNILFSLNFKSNKNILFEVIVKAIQLEEALQEKSGQLKSQFILKMMFQYSYYTECFESQWVRFCKKVVEKGFNEQKAGLQQCCALIILYQVQEGKIWLQLLQEEMQNRQFFQLYQHLAYQTSMSKWQIASRIFTKLVGPF